MNQALKRIEEALNQLESRKNVANPIANSRKPTYSFDLHPPKSNSFTQTKAAVLERGSAGVSPAGLTPPFSAFSPKLPDLNPETKIFICSEEITQDSLPEDSDVTIDLIVRQIQDLYHSGPIVDATLEYYPPSPESSDEITEVCFERVIEVEVSNLTSQEIGIPGASYRLCGVDASGKQWSYPCPLDQLLSVSVAIARYQKLQQLLQQKYELEKGLEARD